MALSEGGVPQSFIFFPDANWMPYAPLKACSNGHLLNFSHQLLEVSLQGMVGVAPEAWWIRAKGSSIPGAATATVVFRKDHHFPGFKHSDGVFFSVL